MSRRTSLDKRIEEQTKKKNLPPPAEDDDLDILLEHERNFWLNKQKSAFDTPEGNRSPGINTAPSIFEKTTIFNTET
ncbi:MAG: hypothetical protein RSD32_04300 [Oscillospiraceae bacterium]